MNQKLLKITEEIEKYKKKILDYTNRLRELERQKTELENADIVALVRGVHIAPDDLLDFIKAYKEQSGAISFDAQSKNETNDKEEVNNIEN